MSELKRKIAVIGMAGRFPMAENIEQFWENLKNAKDCITRDSKNNEKNYIASYGKIQNLKDFDADFFKIYSRKARNMDPASRIMLELTQELLENTGLNNEKCKSRTGLYISFDDAVYIWNNIMQSGEKWYKKYQKLKLYLASRCENIAYYFKFKGPAIISEYAYASSINSIHQACLAIKNGDCEIAIAGGASIDPEQTGYDCMTTMSATGITRPFDKNADGFVPASAAGLVALKDFDKAVREHDNIIAVIDGTFVNNDGRGTEENFAAPSVEGKIDCITNLLKVSDKNQEDIDYFECHGTATKIGDEIEIKALKEIFDTEKRNKDLLIGSVKSNIGHSGVASGICNFIKTALMIKNKTFVPTINFIEPNDNLKNSKIKVSLKTHGYKDNKPFTAIAASVGIGGANAMVLLEEYTDPKRNPEDKSKYFVLPVSAQTPEAAKKISDEIEKITESKKYRLDDIAFTLQTGRRNFDYRTYIVAGGNDLKIQKRRIIESDLSDRKKVFVYSGSTNMERTIGKELYNSESTFRRCMDKCFESAEKIGILGIKDFFMNFSYNSYDTIHDSKKLLILTLSIGYSMTNTLINYGITPNVLIGHSSGEYCAAVISGIMTLEQAMSMLSYRHDLFHKLPEGGMINVFASEEKIKKILIDGMEIGAVNAPERLMLTGRKEICNKFEAILKDNSIIYSRMKTSFTGHSSMINIIKDDYYNYIKNIKLNKGNIKVISTCITDIDGNNNDMSECMYWANQMRLPVRFSDTIKTIDDHEKCIFIEIGVSDTLTSMIRKLRIGKDSIPAFSVFDSPVQKNSVEGFMGFLGDIWSNKINVEWTKTYDDIPYKVPLTNYPFERKEYWSYKNDLSFIKEVNDNDENPESNKKSDNSDGYNDTEKYLIELFKNILGVEVKVNDDLYLYGLDSLALMNAVSHINEKFNVKIKQSELNSMRKIEEMDRYIKQLNLNEKNTIDNKKIIMPLKPIENFFNDI